MMPSEVIILQLGGWVNLIEWYRSILWKRSVSTKCGNASTPVSVDFKKNIDFCKLFQESVQTFFRNSRCKNRKDACTSAKKVYWLLICSRFPSFLTSAKIAKNRKRSHWAKPTVALEHEVSERDQTHYVNRRISTPKNSNYFKQIIFLSHNLIPGTSYRLHSISSFNVEV